MRKKITILKDKNLNLFRKNNSKEKIQILFKSSWKCKS